MAGKRKNPEDAWLPPRVYRGQYSYIWKPKDNETLKLCPLDAPRSEVWKAYESALKGATAKRTVSQMIDAFFNSTTFARLSVRTKMDYEKYAKTIRKVFGAASPAQVTAVHVQRFVDKMGERSVTQANRHLAFLRRVYSWGPGRGWCPQNHNPCKGIEKQSETARDRYITDEEYQAVYECAEPVVKAAMEISYLCIARKGDVLSAKRNQVWKEGLYIKQGKTGKKQVKEWGERLRRAVFETAPKSDVESMFLLPRPDGSQWTERTFHAAWERAREAAAERFGIETDFTFHDLKAKGLSDFDGTYAEKQVASGHKREGMVHTYDRKVTVVPTVETAVNRRR